MTAPAPSERRSPREVIDAAIAENRHGEYVCYGIIVLTAVVGVVVLSIGVIRDNNILSGLGAIVTATMALPLKQAKSIRDTNVAIRLLEIPLADAVARKDLTEFYRTILLVFSSQFKGGQNVNFPQSETDA